MYMHVYRAPGSHFCVAFICVLPLYKMAATKPVTPLIRAPTQLFTFDCYANVFSIAPESSDRAWVIAGETSVLQLRDKTGDVVRDVDLRDRIDNVAIAKGGTLLVSCDIAPSISKLSPDLTVKHFVTTSDNPGGMAIANDSGNLVVCLWDRKCVAVYSKDGKLLREIGPQLGPKTQFQRLYRVAVNGNGDLCVSDNDGDSDSKSVIIMDGSGNIRATYTGPPDTVTLEEAFNPRGICCDRYNHIMVADVSNSCVHMLDGDGHFLQILLSESDGLYEPWSVAVDPAGHLWVGDGNYRIRVYSYT
jgi:hypothetical protein